MFNDNNSNLNLTNCVLFGNGGAKTFYNNSILTATYSLLEPAVRGYTSSPTNLTTTVSPFVSATDARLQAGSVAINAGSNQAYSTANGPATDLAGNVRIQNGIIDMGAYERALPADLTLLLYARPTLVYGSAPFSVVVDVVEINGVASSGLITVKITKDARISLSLNEALTSVEGRSVQNGIWTLNSDAAYYILTTSQSIGGGDKLSVDLTGQLSAGSTTGMVNCSATVVGGGESRLGNNTDADKVEYFQQ